MDTFQERITALFREAKDTNYRLNQKDFAFRFGASRSQLKGWLSGAGAPSTGMLITIARKCNVSADWLIGNTDIRTPVEEFVKQLDQLAHKEDSRENTPGLAGEETAPGENTTNLNSEELKFLRQYRMMDERRRHIFQELASMMVLPHKND